MTLSNRLLFNIPGIIFLVFSVIVFAKADLTELFNENWWVNLFFLAFSGFSFYFGFAIRLITSSNGIQYYFLPPLHFTVVWKDLKNISGNQRGIVNLSFFPSTETIRFQKLSGGTIQLSMFVDDWENSELISEFRNYAPQLKIPEQLIIQPKLKAWHRPGMMMVYYVVCFIPSIFLSALAGNFAFHLNPIGFPLILAAYGFIGGIFGGMWSLLHYSNWLIRFHPKKKFSKKFEKTVRLNYLLPFSGWTSVFVVGLIAQFLGWNYTGDFSGGIFHGMSFLVGFAQSFFLPYINWREDDY